MTSLAQLWRFLVAFDPHADMCVPGLDQLLLLTATSKPELVRAKQHQSMELDPFCDTAYHVRFLPDAPGVVALSGYDHSVLALGKDSKVCHFPDDHAAPITTRGVSAADLSQRLPLSAKFQLFVNSTEDRVVLFNCQTGAFMRWTEERHLRFDVAKPKKADWFHAWRTRGDPLHWQPQDAWHLVFQAQNRAVTNAAAAAPPAAPAAASTHSFAVPIGWTAAATEGEIVATLPFLRHRDHKRHVMVRQLFRGFVSATTSVDWTALSPRLFEQENPVDTPRTVVVPPGKQVRVYQVVG